MGRLPSIMAFACGIGLGIWGYSSEPPRAKQPSTPQFSQVLWGKPMPPAFSLSAGKSVLRVQTIAGDEKTINADANTQIVSVASWCPHSHSFVRAISDPRVKRELRHKKWVFIMEADEWPAVRRQLDELASDPTYHGPSPADQVRRLKERAGGGGVFDPGFLDTLPGDLYFFPTSFLQSDPPLAFPSLYSASTGKFEGHAASSLPKSVRDLYHKYDAEN